MSQPAPSEGLRERINARTADWPLLWRSRVLALVDAELAALARQPAPPEELTRERVERALQVVWGSNVESGYGWGPVEVDLLTTTLAESQPAPSEGLRETPR